MVDPSDGDTTRIGLLLAGRDYPRTYREFVGMFAHEEACRTYLEHLRWPAAFACPTCGASGVPWRQTRGRLVCSACRHQTSVGAGTILDKTRTPLTTWFEAAWHLTTAKNGLSAQTPRTHAGHELPSGLDDAPALRLDYQASVLHRFDDFGPNGIVHHASGYLLVCGGAALWKVPLDDPAAATPVTLPEDVPGQDGMVWTADGRLAIVSNSGNRVVALTSEDDWATANLAGVATYETQATTAAVVDDDIYVVHPHFADEDPPSLERVVFE